MGFGKRLLSFIADSIGCIVNSHSELTAVQHTSERMEWNISVRRDLQHIVQLPNWEGVGLKH